MAVYINVSNAVAGERAGFVEFVISLSASSAVPVTVSYVTSDGTAGNGFPKYDYTRIAGSLVFAPGVTTQTVRVAINDDIAVEGIETFVLTLSNPINGVIAKPDGFATIIDNDTLADIAHPANLSVRDVVIDASSDTATFTVSLDKATGDSFSVAYATSNGSATAGSDYTATSGALDFGAGETAKTVTVAIPHNGLANPLEVFNLALGAVSGKAAPVVVVADGIGQATIGGHGQTPVATPSINVSDAVAGEQDGYVEFVVSLSAPSQVPVSVNYDTMDGTAGEGFPKYDYVRTVGKLVFAPGVTTQTVRVAITDDTTVEGVETFILSLSNAINGVIAKPDGGAIIVDNDTLADTVHPANLSVRDVVIDASADTATFTVLLDKATSDSFSVAYATSNGSATSGSDYTATSGILTFGAGETAKTVTVTIPHNGLANPLETFNLNLGALSGKAAVAVVVADGIGQATIGGHGQTPVATPSVNVSNAVAGEQDGYVDFVVSLSAPSPVQVSVNYDTSDGTAGSGYPGYDYARTVGKLVFAPGVTTQTVRVAITDDTTAESVETFTLTLSNPTNAVIAKPDGFATIVDNDTLADVVHPANLSVRDVVIDASADVATFTVLLDKATSDSFSVAYATSNGSATSGSDYTATSGILSFGAGETAKTVTVAIPHNGLANPLETFNLNLGALTGRAAAVVVVADGIGQASIGSHGQTPVSIPSINISNAIAGERDGYLDFVVSLSAPSTVPVSVSYDTHDGGAGYGYPKYDYARAYGTLVFAPGVTTQTVRVAIVDDAAAEIAETFVLTLSAPINAVIAKPDGVATIVDNDTLADTVHPGSLSVRDVVVDGKADTVTFEVLLDKATSDNFSVAYATSNGSATAGSDYTATSGVLTFAAGETAKTVTVGIVHDGSASPLELFNLSLGAIGGKAAATVALGHATGHATIGAHGQALVATPAINVGDVIVGEKNGYVDFVVSLSSPSSSQVSVAYSTSDGTAGSGYPSYDYGRVTGKLVFEPGVTTQTVRVEINADAIAESTETFSLQLSGATNAVIAKSFATASIVDASTQSQVRGGPGLDTVSYSVARENFTITRTADGFQLVDNTGANGTDLLQNVERIHFANINIGLDTDGVGGQAYRIYQAAFNRTPDSAGLGFWMSVMDKGASLPDIAAGFMTSAEFKASYGANPTNLDLVSKIYTNVLHRAPEAAGLNYWVGALDHNSVSRAEVLSYISESAENKAEVIKVIANGFAYIPYG